MGRRIDDAVCRKLVRILKARDRCRSERSIAAIDRSWLVPQPTQLALKPLDAVDPIRAGTLRKACPQGIPGVVPHHAVDRQIVRLLKALDGSGRDRTVATVDGARLKAQPAELALKGFDLFDAIGCWRSGPGGAQTVGGQRTYHPVDRQGLRPLKALDRSHRECAVLTIDRAGLESELAELSLQRAYPFDPLGEGSSGT